MVSYIVLTRPSSQNQTLAQLIAQHSTAQLIDLPALTLTGLSFHELTESEQQVIRQHAQADLIFAVSSNAVHHFIRLVHEAGIRLSHAPLFAAVGVSSQGAWQAQGVPEQQIITPDSSQTNDSEGLWAQLQNYGLAKFKKVLIARAQTGRNWFVEQLQDHSVQVSCLTVYLRQPSVFTAKQLDLIKHALSRHEHDVCWLISSIESATHILSQVQQWGYLNSFSRHRFVVVHQRIADFIQKQVVQLSQGQIKLSPHQFRVSDTQANVLLKNLLTS